MKSGFVVAFGFALLLFSPCIVRGSEVSLIESSIWETNLTPVRFSATAWGDVNNDGNLDLALSGCLGNAGGQDCTTGTLLKIYLNNGTTLTENNTWQSNLIGIGHGTIAWGDVNNDGNLDLITSGCTIATSASGCTGNVIGKVYINNGTSLIENSSWSFEGIYYGNLALGDVNNDGRLDLTLMGSNASNKISKIYINNGTSFVENSTWENNIIGLNWGSLSLGDINNDELLDLALTGKDSSYLERTKIYINNGTSFVENSTWENNLKQSVESGVMFGDYDNDGDLDLVLMGCCDYLYVYENNGTSFIESQKNSGEGGDLGGGLFDGSIAFGDYNNDGYLDFVGIGREDGRDMVYKNNGTGYFLLDNNAASDIREDDIRHGALAWCDLQKDGNLDLIVTGYGNSDGGGLKSKIYMNNASTSNSNPDPPTILNCSYESQRVTFNWNNGIDVESSYQGLYYNLRVGTCSGCHDVVSGIFGGSSGGEWRGGGPSSGYFGNMMQRKSITLNRPDLENKTIYWAVQTIDTGLAKSAWSTEQVYHITQQCTESWSYGEWSACSGGQQTRTATDLNSCGTFVNRSAVVQSCSSTPSGGSPGYSPPPSASSQNKSSLFENATWYFEKINAGVDTGFILNETIHAVNQVWIKVKNEASEVYVDIKKLETRPSITPNEPAGNVYQYLNITFWNLSAADIELGKIRFGVDKEWIENNSINKSTVTLNRYFNNDWQSLKTAPSSEDDRDIYYLTETPGFSIFAITGEVAGENQKACAPLELRCLGNEAQECSADGTTWEAKQACALGCDNGKCKEGTAEFFAANPYMWLIAVFVLVAVAAGAVLKMRHPKAQSISLS